MDLEAKTVHAPEIGQLWLNSPPLSMRALRGRVVLLDFWDYTCVNCIRTLPYIKEWHRRYRDKGLAVIGVHAPEFYFASVPELVEIAIRDFGIEYPVVLDNDYQIWQAYTNRYWPAEYLIDAEGYVRYFHPGEGDYGTTETAIQQLLREINPAVDLPPVMEPVRGLDHPGALAACQRPTPESYLGHSRGPSFLVPDKVHRYRFGSKGAGDRFELDGLWLSRRDCLDVAGDGARLRLPYEAAEVNLVLAAGAETPVARLDVKENGAPLGPESRGADVRIDAGGATYLEVTRPRMYSIVRGDQFRRGVLEFSSSSRGLQLFAFTFVTCL